MSGADPGSAIADFVAMGGHGLYVWLSYGAAVGVVLYNQLSVRRRERRWIRDYLDRERRHASAREPGSTSGGVVES